MPSESFFRLRRLPGNAWPSVPDGDVSQLWLVHQEMERTQWLDPEAIVEGQLAQVRLLLEHAAQHVPYWRTALSAARIAPSEIRTMDDFRRLPLLRRADYQKHAAEMEARTLPMGTLPTSVNRTSGTTGLPVDVYQTNVTQLWWLACFMRDTQWCGFDPLGKMASLRTIFGLAPEQERAFLEGWETPFWNPQLARLFECGPACSMDLHQAPEKQLEFLKRMRPDYLQSYPSNLDYLAGLLRERGETLPGLKAIQTFAESLLPEVEARIAAGFGVPVKNLYSCCEAGYVASPCPEGHGLHVHAENVLVEVLDASDRPCEPGQTGRIVMTVLHNFRGPFIRYEILDEATVGERCACGRGLPLLKRVWGKRRPMFRLPGGRVASSVQLVATLHAIEEVRQHQIVQKAIDHVVVRVVTNAGWTEAHAERIRSSFQETFGVPVRIEVEVVERLELPASGKLTSVMTEVPADASASTAAVLSSAHVPAPPPAEPSAAEERPAQVRIPAAPRSKKTVLIGWELGNGFGHIDPLLRIARELASHGHHPVFALRDIPGAWPRLRNEPYPLLQAPIWHRAAEANRRNFLASSFADILAVHGFDDVESLMPMVLGWSGILEMVRPNLVLCDHSPTLCLASYGILPTVVLGNGFTMPPCDLPAFPTLMANATPRADQQHLLRAVQEVQRRRGRPVPERLPQAVAGTLRFVTALPDVDPYQEGRRERCVGPLHALPQPMPRPTTPTFFAYLGTESASLETVLTGLNQAGIPGIAYVRGATEAQRQQWRRPGLEILDEPAPIADLLRRVSAVVHHGGGGMAQQCLAAGRPQLLFPMHLEQSLTAQRLHRLGVAHYLISDYPIADIPVGLNELVADGPFAERAQAVARDLHAKGPWDPLPEIVERCLAILA